MIREFVREEIVMKDLTPFEISRYNSKSRWIFISAKDSFYFPDAFIELVKKYQSLLSGKVIAGREDMQYIIDNDPLNLIFQWDDLFGIVIIVPSKTNIDKAKETISNICDELNKCGG
jgi:hypothetical protein